MPNISLWLGLIAAGGVLSWSLFQQGVARNILNAHGLLIVLGGTAAAMLINTPAAQLFTALRTLLWIMAPAGLPSRPEVAAEVIRLSHKARAEGGLLALRDESPDFAGGFLRRALETAAACSSPPPEIRGEIRNRRPRARMLTSSARRNPAPMFGLLGTLLGMLQVPPCPTAKLGPAMARPPSAFTASNNFPFIPIAGQIRLRHAPDPPARDDPEGAPTSPSINLAIRWR